MLDHKRQLVIKLRMCWLIIIKTGQKGKEKRRKKREKKGSGEKHKSQKWTKRVEGSLMNTDP